MASFEVTIRGIALCFYSVPESTWNIILPCDDYHLAEMSYNGKRLNLRDRGRAITIDFPKDAISAAGVVSKPSPPGLFNMSAGYAHGVQATGESTLKLKDLRSSTNPVTGQLCDFVHLRFPNATMSSREQSVCNYFVQEVTPQGSVLAPRDLKQQMNRLVVLEFSSTADISLVAKDLRDSEFSPTVGEFPTFSTASYAIEIDNHCHSVSCPVENDFLHLYWIVAESSKRRFQAGQFLCKEAEELQSLEVGILTVPYGNCDPAESNPPPG